ncbi:MAG: RNA polymerase subunit sigma-24, partial [Bryobacterales bacterium]|nr:RNA polymerase subunit sigma-24 [Bryobacterales bacterium]
DHLRRNKVAERGYEHIGMEMEARERTVPDFAAMADDDIGDDLLRLMFTACHPVLSAEARVALTLRLLGGLSTQEVARAFLTPEATMAQRIVRAKRTLAEHRVPFAAPRGYELAARLSSVLEVLYLIFNEGYAATAGDEWIRSTLCEEALRLGRVLAGLISREAEVHGLVALMEIQASRLAARTDADGEPVLLLDQDRSRWDWESVERGLASLDRALELSEERGVYVLQASIAACHARAREAEETDWRAIAELYGELFAKTRSPVVEMGRAMAAAKAYGAAEGLKIADGLMGDESLRQSHRLPSVRGDLLFQLGRVEEARSEFARAAELALNATERKMLLRRMEECR